MGDPKILDDDLFVLLRSEDVKTFNDKRDTSQSHDLSGANLSRLDLRGLDADNLDLRDVYFRMTDLRGIDFRKSNLEGASFADANISGCYFPKQLSAEEITLSLSQGTRVRYTSK